MLRRLLGPVIILALILTMAIIITLTGWLNPDPATCMWLPMDRPYRKLYNRREIMTCGFDGHYYEWYASDVDDRDPTLPREYVIEGVR